MNNDTDSDNDSMNMNNHNGTMNNEFDNICRFDNSDNDIDNIDNDNDMNRKRVRSIEDFSEIYMGQFN